MATATRTVPPRPAPDAEDEPAILPLESGDRLARDEFERRYRAMPSHIRAELVEGVVYVASPVSRQHGRFHFDLTGWASFYQAFTPGIEGAADATIRLDLDNEPQPDILLRIAPDHGGRSATSEDDYFEGGPELVIEVAASSASYDLHDKLNAYRRNGVVEYVVWRVRDHVIDWFVLRGGRYERLTPTAEGQFRSEVFPGLWLDVSAALRGDMAAVLRILQEGIASPEHAAFVARLQGAAATIAASMPVPPAGDPPAPVAPEPEGEEPA